MLNLINEDRRKNSLPPVALGSNSASQAHAEMALRESLTGHWGLDGLKPYMRYTQVGGTNYEAENVSGPAEALKPGVTYQTKAPEQLLQEAETGLMNSPGHRRNILNPSHKRVNLGIACSNAVCAVDQQFEGDYVQFEGKPGFDGGTLAFAGRMTGFTLSGVQIWYDPLPEPITADQIRATRCYSGGTPIAFLRDPPAPGTYYTDATSSYSWDYCREPRDVSPDGTSTVIASGERRAAAIPWVTATVWITDTSGLFYVEADVSAVLGSHGSGVYTVRIWGDSPTGQQVELTNYSIWVKP